MKILFDHQTFQNQRIGGISRYFAEIIKYLSTSVDVDLSITYTFNEYLKGTHFDFQWCDQLVNQIYPSSNFKGKKRLLALCEEYLPAKYPKRYEINQKNTIEKLKMGDFDIFHPTFFDDYFLDHLNGKPYVLTVHDMILELYPEFLNSPRFIQRKKKLVDRAAHIITVSNNTKTDLTDIFGVDPSKISVIYHAASLSINNSSIDLPAKYILFVGDRRMGYKNFLFFIATICPILAKDQSLNVLCTGSEFTSSELSYFKDLGISNQMKHIYVADTDLYTCYKQAQMLVFPSYYEGFGIPIVEAFQAECPVVLADASCFKEIAGDAALYFPPKSTQGLQEKVENILSDSSLRNKMIEKGSKRLLQYSWEKSAQQTLEVYQQILK